MTRPQVVPFEVANGAILVDLLHSGRAIVRHRISFAYDATGGALPYRHNKSLSRVAMNRECCRRRHLMMALLFAVTHSSLGLAEDFYSHVKDCTREHDDARRLACFDREMAAPPTRQLEEQKDSKQSTSRFGLSETQQNTAAKPQKVTAKVAAIANRADGGAEFSLDNGQIWKGLEQIDFPVKPGDSVTISAGALGGFWLSFTTGSNRTLRVKRVTPKKLHSAAAEMKPSPRHFVALMQQAKFDKHS